MRMRTPAKSGGKLLGWGGVVTALVLHTYTVIQMRQSAGSVRMHGNA